MDDIIHSEIVSSQGALTSTEETIDRIQRVAIALFVGYIDAALTMSESYGGGGSISSNWGKMKMTIGFGQESVPRKLCGFANLA